MKKLITICVGLIVAGCATTTQLDEANAKIQDLEKRLAELEMKANLASRSPFVSHIPRLRAQSTAEEQKGSDGAPAANTIARTQSQPGNGAGGFISARRRREQREAEAAAEDKKRREVEEQREAEREEQRKQLLAIQEEIRRVRESKAAEMAKEDGREAEAVAKEEERKRAEAEKAAKEAEEKKAVDAKIDAFLKEYLGVQFGDSIDKLPGEKNCRVIPVLKKFKYFNKAYGKFIDGKLYSVLICADIDEKFSVDSTREKIEQAFADLAVTLDLQSTAFNVTEGTMRLPQGYKNLSSYRIRKVDGRDWVRSWREAHHPNGFRRYGASITNSQLAFQLNAERQQAEEEARRKANATGETLPDPE